jgi:SAM-dependent methyltransferase
MMNRPARNKTGRQNFMSATANLFVPEIADLEGEQEFSLPLPAVLFGDPRQNYFAPPAPAEVCEAIVSHYESRLNAADGAVLHLGADRGELMEVLRQHGFAVMGCEPLPGPTRLARAMHGFDARTLHCSSAEKFLQWMQRIGQKAQAVFFRHGWEHNLELQALLSPMADILCDGGRIIAVLPPPAADHPREAHLSFLYELAVAGASSNAGFEIESVDCDFDSRFMAFVLKKMPTLTRDSACHAAASGSAEIFLP